MLGRIYATALSPDDAILATGGPFQNFGIRLVDFNSGKMNAILNGHKDIVIDLAFGPTGSILISGSGDKTARIWDVHKNKALHVLKGHQAKVSAVTISTDGTLAATGSDDANVRLWNTRTGELIDTLKGHKAKISSVSFTPDGKYLLSGSNDTTIRLWDGKTGRFIKVLSKIKNGVTYFSISPDGKKLVTGIGPKGMLSDRISHVISIPSGQKVASFNKHNNTVISVDISQDGKTVASAGGDKNEIYLWDLTTGRIKNKLVGKGDSIHSVGFSEDGNLIAWGKEKASFDVMKLGQLQQSFRIKSDEGNFSLKIGEKIRSNHNYYGAIKSAGPWEIKQIAVNPYKDFIILKDGKEAHRISRNPNNGEPHTCMTLTPDGRYVISGGHDGTIIAYRLKTGEISHKFYGHPETVGSISVSPDSRLLVSGSSDNTIKLWEISTGKLLLTIFQGADDEWVAWISDGNYISSPRGDKYVGWHVNNGPDKLADFYSAYQFERVFYRPDHVNDYLANYRMFEKFEALTGIETSKVRNIPKVKPPKINITFPEYGKTFLGDGKIPLKLSVNSDSIDMNDYSVYVNNIPVTPSFERTLKGSEKRSFVRQLNIPLFNNMNKIRVEIFNGYTMGLSETVVYRKGNVKAAKKGNLYLLSIGVNQFPKMPGNNLEFAAADANSLDAYYRKKDKRYFKNIITKSISDVSETKPSKDNILNSLDFIKKASAEDTVIIFLASHGLSDRAGNYYFIPRDATVEDIKELINGSPVKKSKKSKGLDSLISWEEFFEALRSVPGKRLLVVDTCQAKNIEGTLDFHSLAKRSAASSFALLAASKGDEESQEYPAGKHGLFTYALLKGLSGKGDVNKDGQVDLSELYDFIGRFVEKNIDKSIGKQTPQLTAPKELKGMVLSSS